MTLSDLVIKSSTQPANDSLQYTRALEGMITKDMLLLQTRVVSQTQDCTETQRPQAQAPYSRALLACQTVTRAQLHRLASVYS